MLFYNHKQEFIGIDEEGLKLLNYGSLEELLEVCSDVADLFAKEPGYIHNFKSFGWIDFILHADSDARSAIVHGNGRIFSCTLNVSKLFLCENPAHNGYTIDMTHVKSISGDEIKPFAVPPTAAIEPILPPIEKAAVFAPKAEPVPAPPSILPDYTDVPSSALSEPGTLDVPAFEEAVFEPFVQPLEEAAPPFALPVEKEEPAPKKEYFQAPPPAAAEPISRPVSPAVRYSPAEQAFIKTLKVDPSYRFDPNVAAGELGLPVDLIEEFIGDFIQQSHDFRTELFEAALRGDMNNLKILSHKLKGVASNLRIEDALENLSIINTSGDPIEIEANLKHFYAIIAKLEGKEPGSVEDAAVEEFSAKTAEAPASPASTTIDLSGAGDEEIYEFVLKHEQKEPAAIPEEEPYFKEEAQESVAADYLSGFANQDLTLSEPAASEAADTEFEMPPLHYDKQSIAASLGIDEPFMNELIEDYKQYALVSGQQITEAVSAFDTHAWKKSSAELKGISDNLRLSEISDELAILSSTNDAQEARKASKRLNSYLEQL